MARWTSSQKEIQHLELVSKQISANNLVKIKHSNGFVLDGVVRQVNIGNNGGQDGWRYYGEVTIDTTTYREVILDYLDIESVTQIPEKFDEFVELGLVEVQLQDNSASSSSSSSSSASARRPVVPYVWRENKNICRWEYICIRLESPDSVLAQVWAVPSNRHGSPFNWSWQCYGRNDQPGCEYQRHQAQDKAERYLLT